MPLFEETVARAPGCPRKTFIVQCGSEPLRQEGHPMCGPGEYRPDPSEGITVPADLPQPEIVPYSRNDIRNCRLSEIMGSGPILVIVAREISRAAPVRHVGEGEHRRQAAVDPCARRRSGRDSPCACLDALLGHEEAD